jgi:putative flippase GtrA
LELLSSELVAKFIRYAFVGFTGVIVDFSVTYIFKEYLKVSKYVANSLGFCTAVITNYLLNRYWTFGVGKEDVFIQFGTFLAVSMIGLLIIYMLNEKLKINFYVSKVMAIIVVILWNFFVNYYYTFRSAA